ncbi:gamma-glutamyl-gamma-aminobutyraldehyde dehydrogenase [Paracoccus halophilus]|uniref:Aldehyde dehydrogenase n=1 Tax=Paracoccus halophilus TaxID=376733 RepID=A0A099EWA5_9RHOB|nr:aldehyde dehydrogenase [Paracoccus halophilus]KGJ02252.1 aldehyde dehydrogenase [Paracoccus halophilus]SFA61672.1 gamma-glutamyl-gamma-aminobutyraldehyde dehydrogenase [Paracoccus halophilus]
MTDLLGKDDYGRIAATLALPDFCFIDGRKQAAQSGRSFASTNPANGSVIANLPACDGADVDLAVAAARTAFEDGRWSRLHPAERKAALLRLADLIEQNLNELAVMESLDSGKTILDCVTVDLPETVKCLRWHAELIDKIYDQVSPASDSHIALIVREAVGVVGLVLPWNFPLLMLAWKIGPALAAGCTLVVKPAEETSLTALRVAELALEAGIPAGVLNVVTGSGPEVGEPIGRHPGIDALSFTGSTETGRLFLKFSAESNLKEVTLEMGGKNPCIVMEDAEDLDAVAEHVVNGAYWNMGENCSAISRLIVHRDIRDALVERLVAALADWPVGDPLDPASRIGPLVSAEHFGKVASYLDGGKVLHGGATSADRFVHPTILEVAGNDARPACEEIFGPVLSIITVDSLDEAVAIANDTGYGLTASVFTANGKRALRTARALRAGTVTVNSFGEGDSTTPFGGFKQSGFGGRDNGIHAHDQYTQLKTIWLDLN